MITKTLGISKFIYPLTSTDIDKQYIKILQTEFNKYIWDYKPAKVKHNALIGDYKQGGLKSIDIATNVKALRLPWMCRIIQGEGWNDIVNLYLKPIGGLLFLLRCNYDTAVLPFISTFYKNMLDYASEIMFKHLGQNIIWNNRNILVEGKSIFFREWYEKGVVFLSDLCDENGAWLSFDTFCNTYNVRTNFLRYLGVISAAKNAAKLIDVDLSQKHTFDSDSTTFTLLSGKRVNIAKSRSKEYYKEFIDIVLEAPIPCGKWFREYSLSQDKFYNSLVMAKRCSTEAKLLAIQFKIIHNLVNCNGNLYKWKISDTDLCEFCNLSVKDNIVHALYECPSTANVLVSIFSLLVRDRLFSLDIDVFDFIFDDQDLALNLMFLLIKKEILRCRTHKCEIAPQCVFRSVLRRILYDKSSLTEVKFSQKWNTYHYLVEQSDVYRISYFG